MEVNLQLSNAPTKGSLTGDQWPKGLTEKEVKEIAREEAANALAALAEEVANSPGLRFTPNGRELHQTIELAAKKMRPETERL